MKSVKETFFKLTVYDKMNKLKEKKSDYEKLFENDKYEFWLKYQNEKYSFYKQKMCCVYDILETNDEILLVKTILKEWRGK